MNNVQNVVAVLSADELVQVCGGGGIIVDFDMDTQGPVPPRPPK